MLTRFSDWPSRLQAFLDACRDVRFKYGVHDCCLFTCDAVLAMTGQDMAEWFRGRYRTRLGAMEAIQERTGGKGVTAVARWAAEEFGMPSVPVASAQRGDMALVGTGAKALLGLVSLSGRDVMCLRREGIVRVDLKHVTAAWRV